MSYIIIHMIQLFFFIHIYQYKWEINVKTLTLLLISSLSENFKKNYFNVYHFKQMIS